MTRKEHLLTIVQEECNEVGQRASKAMRFGINEIQPGQNMSNADRLIQEFNDLVAVMQMLRADGVLQYHHTLINEHMIIAKKRKVEEFLAYSKQQGTLTDEPENNFNSKVETVSPAY